MNCFLRILICIVCICSTSSINATTYTFNGNGNWFTASNWLGNLIGPLNIGVNDHIIINGTANLEDLNYLNNSGLLTISTGGTLNYNAENLTNNGIINIDGTLVNYSLLVNETGAINIKGTLVNRFFFYGLGSTTILNGGTLNNMSSGRYMSSQLFINTGGNFINTGLLHGNLNITGNLSNSGVLAPGNSPGTAIITGDYTASSTARHNFEIAGITTNSFDRLSTTGSINLNGELNVSLINGFSPTTNHDLVIFSGVITGSFTSINIPAAYTLIINSSEVILRHQIETLPVIFENIEAKRNGNSISIIWSVSEEQNVERYEVEKSIDARNFEKIGSLTATFNERYSFSDVTILSNNFYRIKSIDLDGKYQYSKIVYLNESNSSVSLKAFPNPVNNNLIIEHSSKTLSIFIISSDGKVVKSIIAKNNSQKTTIDVSTLKNGVYFLRFINDDKQKIDDLKFIKL